MEKNIAVQDKKKQIIDAIQPTDEHLTSRAGLALFAQYLQSIRLMPIIERKFGSMRKNKKGIAVSDFFAQILCFFMDGSSRHLSWFDHLKRDEGYAALLSCSEQDLASSHAVKRFFWKVLFCTSLPVSSSAADTVYLETEEDLSNGDCLGSGFDGT